MSAFMDFLSSFSSLINFLSLIVSSTTLVTMLRFRKRIQAEFDKQKLHQQANRLVKDLKGRAKSISDGIYSKEFLEEIDRLLNEILVSYSCLPRMLRLSVRYTAYLVTHRCMKDALSGQTRYTHRLSKRLDRISILLGKENER